MKHTVRTCDICHSADYFAVFRQPYACPGDTGMRNHSIVSCCMCGFVYVQKPAVSDSLEAYYTKANKYAHAHNRMVVKKPEDLRCHIDSFRFIDTYLKKRNIKKDITILDAGCATGNFLHIFNRSGYHKVFGVDPSSQSRIIARTMWGIPVATSTIQSYQPKRVFDFISLYSVLEHIDDLDSVLKKLTSCLSRGGLLFISVPDVSRFGKPVVEPFMEFSLEHINFFTIRSLTNLLGAYGFIKRAVFSHVCDIYGTVALDSIWEYTGKIGTATYDPRGTEYIQKYCAKSLQKLQNIEGAIRTYVNKYPAIAVWGAGSLTSRLLATTSLGMLPIDYFIDTNPALQKTTLYGKKIRPPEVLRKNHIPVLVSSYLSGHSMKRALTEKFGYVPENILQI